MARKYTSSGLNKLHHELYVLGGGPCEGSQRQAGSLVLQTMLAWVSRRFRVSCPGQRAGPTASRRERGANS